VAAILGRASLVTGNNLRVQLGLERGQEDFADEGGFAGTAHPGDADQPAKGNLNGKVKQIMAGGVGDGEK
jgi:hypothetical protein